MVGLKQYKQDPHWLLKTTIVRTVTFLPILAACLYYFQPSIETLALYSLPILLLTLAGSWQMFSGLALGAAIATYDKGFAATDLLWILAGLLVTFPTSSIMHSAAHGSYRPRFLNRFLGEVMGFWHNLSIDIWAVVHFYHHKHTDIPNLDPHPALGHTYMGFLDASGKSFGAAFTHHFFDCHGKGDKAMRAFQLTILNFKVRSPIVSLIWFLLLGPKAFVFFYGTNIVFKRYHYAWFNWATHRKTGDEVQVLNLNHGIYKFVNLISWNLYYHGNHHLYPFLINPKNLPQQAKIKEKQPAA
ncbi:fatty acid desaturase [Bdellovibrio sp. HCB290]|uniref:fatty acid desaturase n=1 Tax=Bdellovibrio sp. HCB290 TaxID=3394356 RepID=UPI0039B5AA6D